MGIKNILVIKMSAIGDVIHAMPVSYALKESFPDAKVTWVVEKAAYDLLMNNPYIDEVLLFEKDRFRSIGGLIKNLPFFSSVLREKKFDVALDLQGLGKSGAIAFLSGAPLKLGCCRMREGSNWISRPVCGSHQNGHIVEQYLDVVRQLGGKVEKVIFPLEITAEEQTLAKRITTQAGMDMGSKYIILAIGANWPNKRWPTAHFAQLVDAIYHQGMVPVMIGGSGDQQLAQEITAMAQIPPVNLTGMTTLKQLAYIIKRASALVGGDTGPMHLAVAVGTPVVALMGPTDANRNGPYHGRNQVITVSHQCHGCWKRTCSLDKDCLAVILPEQVINALGSILK